MAENLLKLSQKVKTMMMLSKRSQAPILVSTCNLKMSMLPEVMRLLSKLHQNEEEVVAESIQKELIPGLDLHVKAD